MSHTENLMSHHSSQIHFDGRRPDGVRQEFDSKDTDNSYIDMYLRALMPLLFRRVTGIGKKQSKNMYGSTHLEDDASSSVGEASVSLLPPRSPAAHQESSDQESASKWKRDAFCIGCLAFGMAALAGLLGAYVIFVRGRSDGAVGVLMQAARAKRSIRRPVPKKSELLKPP